MITRQLIEAIRTQYSLPWNGIHGVGHWARVRENGLRIATRLPGVNTKVVELFSVFHDARRSMRGYPAPTISGEPPGRGERGAIWQFRAVFRKSFRCKIALNASIH